MEYADGGDLYQRVLEYQQKGRYMKESMVWDVAVQATLGLKALHDLNVFHRDLKSANLFLYLSGVIKLGDFNVSKVSKTGFLYTQTGTPYYASPEVWQDLPYTPKSDIWSLGCVLYEAAALKPPFRAEDMKGLYAKVMKGEFARLPRCFSNELNAFIGTLLALSPDDRPACSEILAVPHIQRRVRVKAAVIDPQSPLLGTIYAPKNGMVAALKLPAAQYVEDAGEKPTTLTEPSKVEETALPRLSAVRGRQGLTPDARMFESRAAEAEEKKRRDSSDQSKSVTPSRYYKRVLRDSYGGLQVVKRNFRLSSLSRPSRLDPDRSPKVSYNRKLKILQGNRTQDEDELAYRAVNLYSPIREGGGRLL